MLIAGIFIGALFLLIALLFRSPELTGDMLSLPIGDRKNVDMEGLFRFMFRSTIALGAVIIVAAVVCRFAHLDRLAIFAILVPIVVWTAVIILGSQRYDHNPKKRWKKAAIIIGTLLLTGVIIIPITIGSKPHTVIVDEQGVTITGQYGVTIPPDKIATVKILDEPPRTKMRVNGLATGSVSKGWFQTVGYGRARLFRYSEYSGPFIDIEATDGVHTLFNTPDEESARKYLTETKQLLR